MADKQKHKLILVEDSEDDIGLFEKALTRTGLSASFEIVRCLRTGEQAIEYFRNAPTKLEPGTRPAVAVIDISLPGLNGFEVIESLRNHAVRPVIGIFTSSQLDEDKQRAKQLAADLFLTKTFDSPDFERFLHFLARIADDRWAKKT